MVGAYGEKKAGGIPENNMSMYLNTGRNSNQEYGSPNHN
jgi:hypothetical protein